MDIKCGLGRLKACLTQRASDRLPDFHALEARFDRNANDELILGISENTRNERNQVMRALNALALQYCGVSFNELCEGQVPQPPNAIQPSHNDGDTDHLDAILAGIQRLDAKLDRSHAEDRQATRQILDALAQNQIAQAEAVQMMTELETWAKLVQQAGLPLNDELREALDALTQHTGGAYQYLQLALPLIPGILSYNVELGSEHQGDLQGIWGRIKARFSKKPSDGTREQTDAQAWTHQADDKGIASVAISADGRRILAGTLGKRVFCYDQDGQVLWSAKVGNQAWRVGLSADGQIAVVGTGSSRPWDLKGRGIYAFNHAGKILWQENLHTSVRGLSLAADGHTLAMGTEGRELLVYNHEGHRLFRREISGWGWWAWVWATALSADGETIVLGAANKTVQILDHGGNLLGEYQVDADVFTVAISVDGATIAAGSSDQHVYLLNRQGALLWQEVLEDKVWAVALSADGQRVIVGAGEGEAHVRVFDRTGHSLWRRYVEGDVTCVAASAEGEVVGVGTTSGQIYFFDQDGTPLHHATAAKHVRDVAVAAAGHTAVAGSEDGRVYSFAFDATPSGGWGKGDTATAEASPVYHGIHQAWAVLVGVNQYQDPFIASLSVCVDDVTAIQQTLAGSYQVAKLLTDATPERPPTRANILGELAAVAQSAAEEDLLLFYFSGHGIAEGGESYLLARDTRLAALDTTAVAMRDVRRYMEKSPAHAKVIVIDACHSGASIGKAEPRMTPEFIERVFAQAEGMAVLASCKQGQKSWAWSEQGRSVFTYYLLDALTGKADFDGKGFVTIGDANRYVTDGVKTWAAKKGVPQTPTLQYAGAGDIILLRYAEGAEGEISHSQPTSEIDLEEIEKVKMNAKVVTPLAEEKVLRFKLLFKGSLQDLHSLMVSIQEDLHHDYWQKQPPDEWRSPKIPYAWRGISGNSFRVTFMDLRNDEVCGNASAFSVPQGARLEVWHYDNDYARAIWQKLHDEMIEWGFLDDESPKEVEEKKENSLQMDNIQHELVNALLACDAMSSASTRQAIINDLPDDIRHHISHSSVGRVDVNNIVQRCMKVPGGIEELIETLRFYEGNSFGMQKVDAIVQEIRTS